MTFQQKIYSAFGSLMLLGAAVAGAGYYFQQKLCAELDTAIHFSAPKLDLVQAIRARSWELVANMRRAYIALSVKQGDTADKAGQDFKATRARMVQQFAEIRPLMADEPGLPLLDRMEAALKQFDPVAEEYFQACREGQFERAIALGPSVNEFSEAMNRAGLELRAKQREALKATAVRERALRSQITWLNVLVAVLVLLVGAGVAVGCRNCTSTLTDAARQLAETATQVRSAASEIASSANGLAQAASEQAASLEETSASSHEIEMMTGNNARSAKSAAARSAETARVVDETHQTLEQTQSSMDDIVASSGKIAQIIRVIDEIAFQTNILALNAAVEAARAGETGMGFAVVANEVRNLAQRVTQAAGETTQLVEDSIAHSRQGKERLDRMASTIGRLTEETVAYRKLATEVNESSEQQLRGVHEISEAMTQMELVTQQVAAGAEEGAAAGVELNSQVVALNGVVDTLSEMLGLEAHR